MRIRPLQNRVENQIPLIPSILPKRIFVEVRLQVLSGMRGRDNDEKTPVFGMVERGGKSRMMAFVTPDVHVCFGQQTSESGGTSAKRFCRSLRFHVESALPRCRNESSHQIHGVVPEAQRCAAVLKDRSGQRGNLSQTFVAGIDRAAIDGMEFALLVALWA